MMHDELEKALNQHLTEEFNSGYLYLSMAASFEGWSLPGFANWMHVQYQEELGHAMKFYRYLIDRSSKISLGSIQKPPSEWSSPIDTFEATLNHERLMTRRIHDLVDLALSNRDHPTSQFLQWFVSEQVEEEATVSTVLEQLKMIEGSKDGILLLDREFGTRVHVA